MKIAIDESGDSGRRFWRGSTRWFVVAAVIVPDTARECGLTCDAVDKFKTEHMNGSELHFARNSHHQHEEFFDYMNDKEFVYVAVAMDKKQMLRRKPHILASKKMMLQASLDRLFREIQPMLDDPVVLVDKNSRRIDRALKRHLLNFFGSHHKGDWRSIKNVVFVDSKREPLVQFADYVAGAVRHHVDKKYHSQSFEKYLSDKGKVYFL